MHWSRNNNFVWTDYLKRSLQFHHNQQETFVPSSHGWRNRQTYPSRTFIVVFVPIAFREDTPEQSFSPCRFVPRWDTKVGLERSQHYLHAKAEDLLLTELASHFRSVPSYVQPYELMRCQCTVKVPWEMATNVLKLLTLQSFPQRKSRPDVRYDLPGIGKC